MRLSFRALSAEEGALLRAAFASVRRAAGKATLSNCVEQFTRVSCFLNWQVDLDLNGVIDSAELGEEAPIGLGRIVALYDRSSTSYQIH